MSMLARAGIVGENTKTYDVFNRYISPNFLSIPKMSPSNYVSYCWNQYKTNYVQTEGKQPDNSLNGNIFEAIIATVLFREKLKPFYLQASVTYVPNAAFDILLCTSDNKIITLSLKTSFRERYKQADLEGMALRNVHRTAQNYLITMNAAEAENVKRKIGNQEVMFINGVIVADQDEFDDFIAFLKQNKYKKPGRVPVISSDIIIK